MSTDELFRHYAPFVSRFLLRLGVARDAVDDALQEVFLVAHRGGGYLPGPAKPTTYLATIAVRAAAAHRRAQVRAGRSGPHDLDELVAPESDPAQLLETHDSLRQLQSALDRLDDNLRATLLMADGIGQTCPTIAAAMQVPLGTVYWRLDRARKQFRSAWKCVAAGKPAHRNRGVDADGKPTRRGTRAGALIFWLRDPWGRGEARELLRASCEPSAAELAHARASALPRGLTRLDAAPPAWANAVASTPHAGSALSLVSLELASLGALGAAAIALALYVGAGPVALSRLASRAEQARVLTTASPGRAPSAASTRSAPRVAARATLDPAPTPAALGPIGAPTSRAVQPAPAQPATARDVPATPAHAVALATLPTRARADEATSAALPTTGLGGTAAAPSAPEARSVVTSRAPSAASSSLTAPSSSPRRAVEPLAPPRRMAPPRPENLLLEAREVARAERMLSHDPREALRLVRSLGSKLSSEVLREERDYIEVMALARTGRVDDARAASRRFLRVYPESAFASVIQGAVRQLATGS